jgi:hypothetical protein
MNFDTSNVETPCIEDVEYDWGKSPYGTARIKFDKNGRPVGTSLDECFDELDKKLIEFYGESFRRKLNHERAVRGLKPL